MSKAIAVGAAGLCLLALGGCSSAERTAAQPSPTPTPVRSSTSPTPTPYETPFLAACVADVSSLYAVASAMSDTIGRANIAGESADPAGLSDAAYKMLEHKGDLRTSSACDRWAPSQKLAAAKLAAAADAYSHGNAAMAAFYRTHSLPPGDPSADLGSGNRLKSEGIDLIGKATAELPYAAQQQVIIPPR